MIKRIIDNIYKNYKFFTTTIYCISKKNNKIFLLFYSILSILFIFIHHNKIYNKRLGFQAYIVHIKKKNQVNTLNINDHKYLAKTLPNYNNKIIKYKLNIKKILEYLKNTGFLNQLDYFILNINNFKYYIIHIYLNDNIKKIDILNYKNLQIPHKFLINILKPQLGSPINYSQIHNAINRIYTWYIDRGFSYIYITWNYKKTTQSLYLKIFEGQIIENYLTDKSHIILNSSIVNKIHEILIKELNISKKSIFNKKTIDQGIIYLKKVQLLKTCHYKIKKYKQGLALYIEYSIFTNHNGYFYNYDLNVYKNNLALYNIINYSYPFIIPINLYLSPNILQKFIYKISKMNEVYIHYVKYKNNLIKIFNFKYYLHYINCNYKINIQTINNIPEFEFLIFAPYIKINKIIFNFIKLNLYQKIYKTKTICPNKNKKDSNIIENIKIESIGNCIVFNQKIFKKFNYQLKYANIYNTFKTRFLYLKASSNESYKLNYYNRIVEQKITLINTQMKYGNLEYSKFLEPGKILILDFLFLKPQKIIKKSIINKNASNNINFKYYQIILLPKYLKFIMKNTLNIFININSFIRQNYHGNIFNDIKYTGLHIYFYKRYIRMLKYHTKYLYQLEYHIFLGQFYSYYIFSNINNKPYDNNKIFQYNYIIGSGIQINPPIKRLPKIRFEYKINKYNINHYQLRLFSSCTNNN
uniref:hypothetical protein n=1 Tax=Hypnea pseudomusciformis TaxID=1545697 RepID=UPI0027DA6368|nr:hypothetical protein P4C74_pgp121 [Hypnea pseudomusciformis]WCH55112.1 hypothetical protein [Hypnea pseudomusciformis]